MTNTATHYTAKTHAEQACRKRSLFASVNGTCSQFELREVVTGQGTQFVGGLAGELAAKYPQGKIIGQWSGGYRV